MFGEAMKLPDRLVAEYLRVYTLTGLAEIDALKRAIRAGETNPMEAKRQLGRALVERYYDAGAAAAEDEWFTQVFSRHAVPPEMPEVRVADPNATLTEVLRACLPAESSSQLRRLIRDGSVRCDGEHKLTDPGQRHPVSSGDAIRVGRRRWFRITFPA
jgi:tyrosyl-tRNA synthetase